MPNVRNEIKELRLKLSELQNEIERLRRERSQYLVISAHQMKSPLATINFSIGALLKEYAGRLNWKQLRIIEAIKNSTDSLESLVRDILELEKLRVEKVELEDFDFIRVCLKAIEELHGKIQEKEIDLEVNLPHKVLITHGHQLGVKQAVYNLLENAVKYSYRGGSVKITVGYDEVEKTLTFIVRDYGIGIPEEEHERIFEDSYRAPNARKFDKTGTGFGLAIVKRVIDVCGGSINIWSKENEGTKVTVTLPLKETRAPELSVQIKPVKRKQVVVIGGVSAGPKAASRARRLDPDADITLFERGYFLAYAGCTLPYFVSDHLKSRRDLSSAITSFHDPVDFFRSVKGINVKNLSEVLEINPKARIINYRDIVNDRIFSMQYDVLVLATGSIPNMPDIKGIELDNIFQMRGVDDAERIKLAIKDERVRDIVILGGGLIGVEVADALTITGARVTIVEKEDQILSFLDPEMAALVERHIEHRGIRVIKGEIAKAFLGKDRVEYVQLSRSTISAQLVILAMGVKPNVELAKKAGLKIGPTGAIAVNEYMQTSDPAIYAAGDCAECIHIVTGKPYYIPLGSIANRQGRVAGANAVCGQRYRFGPVSGTIIIKVFDYHVAKTGLSEKEAIEFGFEPVTSYVPEYDKERFIPGAEIINIKLIANRKDRRLLGVQIVGRGDVAKRIDIAAIVIAKKGSFEDLMEVDLGYAPSYSNAMGAIVVAAHVLQNKMDGFFEGISAREMNALLERGVDSYTLIDVRVPQDYEEERIEGFDSIPLENLRSRIDEIPRNKGIILVCDSGNRSYQAALVLKEMGFNNVKILEGGMRMWPYKVLRE